MLQCDRLFKSMQSRSVMMQNASDSKQSLLFNCPIPQIDMTRCHLNRKKTCRNQIVEKINEHVIFVFLVLYYGSRKPNHAKNYQKNSFGVLFSLPPQNALQCTTVHCNVL